MKVPCPYYRRCPGCTQLQMPYAKQLRDKAMAVREALGPLLPTNLVATALRPIVPSPLPLAYRASTKLCLNMDSFGQRSIGLYERGSKTVVDIATCPVHAPAINKLVARLFAGQAPLPAPFYQHNKRSFQPGLLKFVTLRHSPTTLATGLIVSHTGVESGALAKWAAPLASPRLGIYASLLGKADEDRILSEQTTHVAGPATLPYELAGRLFQLPPEAFFQANFSLTEAFVQHVTAGLAGDTLLDLYGGFGAYSLALGLAFKSIYLVDGNAAAIAAARLQDGAPPGLTAVHASVEDFLARLPRRSPGTTTHVIVNPPRAGLSPRVVGGLHPRRLAGLHSLTYASCNLETLRRDLRDLTQDGALRLTSVQPFDMFPQTDHIEVVAKLSVC